MADTPIPSPFDGLQGLLNQILGASTKTQGTQTLDINSLLSQLTGVNSTESNTATTNATTNALTQLLSSLTGQTTSSNTEQTMADISALKSVYDRQAAGITPEALQAIFREGAKAAPGLISATSNAVGARAGNNSATANALTELNSNLVSQAALANQKSLADAGNTAAQIAALTKSITNTGTQNTSQSKTDNTSASTTMNQTQALQKLLESFTTMNQTQNQDQTKTDNTTTNTGINAKQTGMAAGLAGLLSLFGALSGGSSGSGGTDWLSQLTKLFSGSGGGGSTGTDPFGNPIYPTPPYHDPAYDPPDDSGGGNIDYTDDGSAGGFADGGQVPTKAAGPELPTLKLTETKSQAPSIQQIMQLAGMGGSVGSGVDLGNILSGMGLDQGNVGDGKKQIPGNPLDTQSAGGDSGAGGSNSNSSSSTNNTADDDAFGSISIGMSAPTLGQVASLGMNAITGNVLGSIVSALGLAKNIEISHIVNPAKTPPLPPITPVSFAPLAPTITNSAAAEAGGGGSPGGNDGPGVGSVTAGPATATDAEGNAIGVAGAMGEGMSVTGSVGDSGPASGTGSPGDGGTGGSDADGNDGTGDGSAGGWADGGYLQKQLKDMNGVKDGINIRASGGEYIVPTDVVDIIGPEFFDALKLMYHKPAALQK